MVRDASSRVTLDLAIMRIARVGMIAAVYAAASLVVILFLQHLAWGPIQLRLSEALCILALLTPDAVLGLGLGCAIANGVNVVIGGIGMIGLFDVVFGAFATVLGAFLMWHMRKRPVLAVLAPVVVNALVIPSYLPLILEGVGFYVIPFTSFSLEQSYSAMYLFGLIAIALGEAIVIYGLGLPLYRALCKTRLVQLFEKSTIRKKSE